MNQLERMEWENIKNTIPTGFEEFHMRIIQILETEKPNETLKIMTLNDVLRVTGVGGKVCVTN